MILLLCLLFSLLPTRQLIHLPGAEIVWAVIEILQGSIIHGASRLIKGLIQATSLAVFLVLGWQVFGRNLASDWLWSDLNGGYLPFTEGAKASLPDSEWCADTFPKYYPDYFTWYFVIGVSRLFVYMTSQWIPAFAQAFSSPFTGLQHAVKPLVS
jgi:hypothetical protein